MQEILNMHRNAMIKKSNDEQYVFLHLHNDNGNNYFIVPTEETKERKVNLEMEDQIDCNNSTSTQCPDDFEEFAEGT